MADTSVRPSPLKEQQDGFKDGYADRPHQRGRTGIYRNGWEAGRAARIEDEYYAQLARIRGVEVPA